MKWGHFEKNDVKETGNEVKENNDLKSEKERSKEFRDSLKADLQKPEVKEDNESSEKKDNDDSSDKGQLEREREIGEDR